MQDDIAIAGRDPELGANLVGLETKKMAHHKYPRGIGRQVIEAGLEHNPELPRLPH